MNTQPWLRLTGEVRDALAHGGAVVALETTIISHGMPYPQNIETARSLEAIVRSNGATPATIGLIDGAVCVGLDDGQLERLASEPGVAKVSRRDFAAVLAAGATGATTVAATMIAAAMAGVHVFATGGIGGVHRGGEQSMDISADLPELAHTPVAVVCAGAKSILDIGRTLEYLETHGVPVLGYRTDAFPSFYARTSGYGVDRRVETPEQIAAILAWKRRLGLGGGTLIANPVPEADALPFDEMERVIGQALELANEGGVRGKDITPFLLATITRLTDGRSLKTNIALVRSNAALAAQVAAALARDESQQPAG
jgi:pseudouridine-5'-phosphate glycosidase